MTDKIDDGGPAFPHYDTDERGIVHLVSNGMSLRDWFAGQAMIGLLQRHHGSTEWFSQEAYRIADAMIDASKEPT